jgi:plasmid maintenance system antidote protein VapI
LALVALKSIVPANEWVGVLRPEMLGYLDVPNDRTVIVAVVDIDVDHPRPVEAAAAQLLGHLRRGGITAEVEDKWAVDVGATPLGSVTVQRYEFTRNWACSPGDSLQEWLQEQGRTVAQFAGDSGIAPEVLGGILAGLTPITEMVAECLAKATGTRAEYWVNQEASYTEGLAKDLRVDGVAPRATPDMYSARSVNHVGAQWLSYAHRQLQQYIEHPGAPGAVDPATIAQAIAMGNALVSYAAGLDRGGWNGW